MLLFSSSFSCFSPGLEVSLHFGLLSALRQMNLSRPEPFGREKFLEGGCHPFQCCPSPLWGLRGSGQLLEELGSSQGLPLCRCCHGQQARAVPVCKETALTAAEMLLPHPPQLYLESGEINLLSQPVDQSTEQFVFWALRSFCSLSWVSSVSPCESWLSCNLTTGPVSVSKKCHV